MRQIMPTSQLLADRPALALAKGPDQGLIEYGR